MSERRPRIVIIDDNEGDIFLVKEALRRESLDCEIVQASNGADGILLLCGSSGRATRPDCILLDLNLPKISGERVLETVRGHDDLGNVPVLVLGAQPAGESGRDEMTFFFPKSSNLQEFLAVGAKIRTLLNRTRTASS